MPHRETDTKLPNSRRWRLPALLLVTLLVVVCVAVVVLRLMSSPPLRDFRPDYKAIEGQLAPGSHDPQAWADFLQLAEAHDRWKNRYTPSVGASGKQIDMEWAYDPEMDNYDVEGSLQMLRAYAEGTTPIRLAALLSDPHLTPPSAVNNGPLDVISAIDLDFIHAARTLAIAEDARLRYLLHSGDAQGAARCLAHIDRLARLAEERPMLVGLLVSIAIDALITGTINDALRDGVVSPEAAEPMLSALTPSQQRLDRALATIEGERILTLSSLQLLYQGEPGMKKEMGADTPRLLWESHTHAADRAERYYEELIAHMESGDALAPYPDDDFAQSLVASYINTSHADMLLPTTAFLPAYYTREAEHKMMMLALALRAYEGKLGAMPERLDELVEAGLLEELPRNPFTTDGVFEYTRDDTTPLGYTLDGSIPEDDDATNAP